MKLCLVFKVLCVLLTLEATRATADTSVTIPNNVDKAKIILSVPQTKTEPNTLKNESKNEDPIVAEKTEDAAAIAAQQKDVNNKPSPLDASDVVAPINMAMIQKQIELLKQPGMRRLARALNRFHQGQLFEPKNRRAIWSKDDDDDAIAEERALRRRTRVRRRNSNNLNKPKKRKAANRNKLTRRKKNSKNSFKRKNSKGVKNQKNRRGLRSGNKKGAKGVKKTKRNRQGQKNTKRGLSNRRKNNRRNNNRKQNNDGLDEDIEDTSVEA